MFENISKGEFKSTFNLSKDRIVRNDGGIICTLKKPTHYSNQDDRYERELEEQKVDAKFIAYCFNLQQRYDISKLEEAVKLLAEIEGILTKGCEINPTSIIHESIEQLLKDIKK